MAKSTLLTPAKRGPLDRARSASGAGHHMLWSFIRTDHSRNAIPVSLFASASKDGARVFLRVIFIPNINYLLRNRLHQAHGIENFILVRYIFWHRSTRNPKHDRIKKGERVATMTLVAVVGTSDESSVRPSCGTEGGHGCVGTAFGLAVMNHRPGVRSPRVGTRLGKEYEGGSA
jgi:hypothetical protein